MKVIFLDIDGVLNTASTCRLPESRIAHGNQVIGFNRFDFTCVRRLNKIIQETGAKIVISSTWRIGCSTPELFKFLQEHLMNEGVVGQVIGRTPLDNEVGFVNELFPTGSNGIRGFEIQKWLDDHKNENIESFVILDDSNDMVHLSKFLVHIRDGWRTGIQDKHVDEAIVILNGGLV